MWTSVFRGLMMALAVTVLALVVVVGVAWWGVGAQYMSLIVDVGLILSCFVAGYSGAYATNRVMPGLVAALAYVVLAIMLLSFYFQVLPFGAVKVLTGAFLLAIVSALVGKARSIYKVQDEGYRSAADRYSRHLGDTDRVGRGSDGIARLRTPVSDGGRSGFNRRISALDARRSDGMAEDTSLSYRTSASQEKPRSYSFQRARPKKSVFAKVSSLFKAEGAKRPGYVERKPYRESKEIPQWYMRGRRGSQ